MRRTKSELFARIRAEAAEAHQRKQLEEGILTPRDIEANKAGIAQAMTKKPPRTAPAPPQMPSSPPLARKGS